MTSRRRPSSSRRRRRHDYETVWGRLRILGGSRETVGRSASVQEGQQLCGKVGKCLRDATSVVTATVAVTTDVCLATSSRAKEGLFFFQRPLPHFLLRSAPISLIFFNMFQHSDVKSIVYIIIKTYFDIDLSPTSLHLLTTQCFFPPTTPPGVSLLHNLCTVVVM